MASPYGRRCGDLPLSAASASPHRSPAQTDRLDRRVTYLEIEGPPGGRKPSAGSGDAGHPGEEKANMKPTNRSLEFLALLSTVVLTASAAVAPISFQPESRLWVDGTSNVRSYSCEATALRGNVAAAGADAS